MNITPMQMYLFTRLDSICFVITGIFVISLVSTACSIAYAWGFPDDEPGWHKERLGPFRFWVKILLVSLVIGIAVPSQKEVAAIYVIPKIANNEKMQAIPSKILDLATEWLDALKPNNQ